MSDNIDTLRQTALNGDPQAQFELGQMYEYGRGVPQDYQEALKHYTTAAERGLAQAEYSIGLLYEHGRGVEANATTAADWYNRASEKGDTWAMNNLAMLFSYGKGVEISEERANELYLRAANLGHFQAQYNLGARYASGRGFDVDLVTAYFWFERSKLGASALNQERANKMIEALSDHMLPEEIVEAKSRVSQMFRQID